MRRIFLVPARGLEPPRLAAQALNLLRMPIPPRGQPGTYYNRIETLVNETVNGCKSSRITYNRGMDSGLPLFTLKTVLFPSQLLPLHVFEPRYRRMIVELIDSGRVIASFALTRRYASGTMRRPG